MILTEEQSPLPEQQHPGQHPDETNEKSLCCRSRPRIPQHRLPKRNATPAAAGAKTAAGRLRSSQNAIKHGACSQTLILPCESEAAWRLLLARWCRTYQISEAEQQQINTAECAACTDHSLTYDFVRKTAEAEWHRLRCQRNYEVYVRTLHGRSPFNWSPEEVKLHDLNLRYKTAAERSFQREYRLLQQHVKFMSSNSSSSKKPKSLIEPADSTAHARRPQCERLHRLRRRSR